MGWKKRPPARGGLEGRSAGGDHPQPSIAPVPPSASHPGSPVNPSGASHATPAAVTGSAGVRSKRDRDALANRNP